MTLFLIKFKVCKKYLPFKHKSLRILFSSFFGLYNKRFPSAFVDFFVNEQMLTAKLSTICGHLNPSNYGNIILFQITCYYQTTGSR